MRARPQQAGELSTAADRFALQLCELHQRRSAQFGGPGRPGCALAGSRAAAADRRRPRLPSRQTHGLCSGLAGHRSGSQGGVRHLEAHPAVKGLRESGLRRDAALPEALRGPHPVRPQESGEPRPSGQAACLEQQGVQVQVQAQRLGRGALYSRR